MSERKFLQVNLSSETTPNAGSKIDETGEKLAKVELQLPGNLIGNLNRGKIPTRVEMKATKLSVPIDNVPIAFVKRIDAERTSNLFIGIIPYGRDLNDGRQLIPDPNSIDSTNLASMAQWWKNNIMFKRIAPTLVSNYRQPLMLDITKSVEYYKTLERMYNGYIPIYKFSELLTEINDKIYEIVKIMGIAGFPAIEFGIEGNTVKLTERISDPQLYNATATDAMIFQKRVTTYSGRIREWVGDGTSTSYTERYMQWIMCDGYYQDPAGLQPGAKYGIDAPRDTRPYPVMSFVANHELVDIFHTLPWVEIDTRIYQHPDWSDDYNFISGWERATGDYRMYVLDTTRAAFSTRSEDAPFYCRNYVNASESATTAWNSVPKQLCLEYTFPDVSISSFYQSQAIVLLCNGLDTFNQILPANISTAAGVLTTVPVLEVYYPTWSNPSDKSDRLIVVKDTFTNTPTISVVPDSVVNRNISFQMAVYTAEGRLFPLTIPHHSAFIMQVTFELYY